MPRRAIRMPSIGHRSSDTSPIKSETHGYGRGSLARAIQWIALNDEPNEHDPDVVATWISTMLVADLFDKEPDEIAEAVVRHRGKGW